MTEQRPELLLVIRADAAAGKERLADQWPDFFYGLRSRLQEAGREEPEDREELLIFRFPDPTTALKAFYSQLKELKRQLEWDKSRGPAPLRLVLGFGEDQTLNTLLDDEQQATWKQLTPEVCYLTPALKDKWRELADPERLGLHHLGNEDPQTPGLTPLRLGQDQQAARRKPLFPHRRLPLAGKLPPCFYCGLTNHEPHNCPAKMLTMQTQGLATVGYLPLTELSDLFREAMERQGDLDDMLVGGVSPGQLRKDLLLRVYVSYFDLNKVFQPRFLAGIAFTHHTQWHELGRPEAIATDNSSLYLGLDCLRVGQYRQAEELFISESREPKGRQLYATVGRALVALEQGRHHETVHFLENALKAAITNKDRVYICLLLYRIYRLQGDNWKAAHSLDNILSFDGQCAEAIYRQIQLAVAEDSTTEAINRIRSLVVDEKTYFIQILIDPELLPIQGAVENILHLRLQNQRQEAEENLSRVRAVAADMEHWLEPEEDELRQLREDMVILEQQEQQQSYYDLLDIADKSRRISQRCYRLQESKSEEMHDRLAATDKKLSGFEAFWHNYPYQSFFPEYAEILKQLEEISAKAAADGARNLSGATYRALLVALAESEENFTRLKELTVKMTWVRNLFKAGKQFLRSLVVAELALISLTIVLLGSLLVLSADSPAASGLTEAMRDPAVQKRMLTMVTLILAPLLALIHTLWRTMEQL